MLAHKTRHESAPVTASDSHCNDPFIHTIIAIITNFHSITADNVVDENGKGFFFSAIY